MGGMNEVMLSRNLVTFGSRQLSFEEVDSSCNSQGWLKPLT